jgi:hypothetical protein
VKRYAVIILIAVILSSASAGFAYWYGAQQAAGSPWFSQKFGTYVIDRPINCPNGKEVGRLQIDYNRKTGKWKTVRDDSDATPDCTLPPTAKR